MMMTFMTEYDNYNEWKAEREAVRDTLHVFDEFGDEIPDEEMVLNLGNARGIRVDDNAALDFVYSWHEGFELLRSQYNKVRGSNYLTLGTTYAYLNDSLGWCNLTEMSRTVKDLEKRYKVA